MKSLLFIGGTGFLGQSFVDCLNNNLIKKLKLSKIIIISRKSKKIESKYKILYLRKNIKDIKKIPVTDYLIYAANSSNYVENLDGVNNFKNLLTKKHKNVKIIFTSSGAVYGQIKFKKKINEKEQISLKKINNFIGYKKTYAMSKIIMEREFNKLSLKGFNVSIVRLFSFIGKRILVNKKYAISSLISQAKNKKSKTIFINDARKIYRGYMSAEDLIKWIVKIILNTNKECEIYNIGSDESITIKDLAKLIAKKVNKIVKLKKKKNTNKNKNEIDYYVPSILKAKKKFDLKIEHRLTESLDKLLIS